MYTLIIYDGNEYYYTTTSVATEAEVLRLIPEGHDLMFVVEDDVDIRNGDFEELEVRAL
jgi:hypothetical protein